MPLHFHTQISNISLLVNIWRLKHVGVILSRVLLITEYWYIACWFLFECVGLYEAYGERLINIRHLAIKGLIVYCLSDTTSNRLRTYVLNATSFHFAATATGSLRISIKIYGKN